MAITAADLQVEVGANTAGAERGLSRVERRMGGTQRKLNGLGKSMRRGGKTMTKAFTLPMVAAAGAAVKMAADFESSMTKIQGLVGASEKQVETYKDAILGMAGDVAKSPQELADALFFITSAGLEGERALNALRMSAMASAAGLGETKQVANAVTNALNAYGEGALDAERATDVLTATVREGKAEASELGPQFGRVLPFASELGVTFDQVGGALAFFTRSTGDAAKAGTFLEGILRALVKPTKQGEKALADIGLTFDEVRASIAEEGLLATLKTLRAEFGDNTDAMSQLFADSNALAGVLQLTGDQADVAAETLAGVADSAGATQKAYDQVSKTVSHQFKQAMEDAKAELIRIGSDLLPLVTDLLGKLKRGLEAASEWWNNLSDSQQKTAGIIAGVVAAAGPLLIVLGSLASAVSKLIGLGGAIRAMLGGTSTALGTTTVAAGKTRGKLGGLASFLKGPFGIAVGAGVAALAVFQAKQANVAEETASLRAELDKTPASLRNLSDEFLLNRLRQNDVLKVADRLGLELDTLRQAALGNEDAMEKVRVATGGTQNVMRNMQGLLPVLRSEELDLYRTTLDLAEATSGFNQELAAEQNLLGGVSRGMQELHKWMVELPTHKRIQVELVTGGFGGVPAFPTGHAGGLVSDLPLTAGLPKGDERLVKARSDERLLTARQNDALERALSGGVTYDNHRYREGDTVYVYTQDADTVVRDIARQNRDRAYLEGE